MMRCRVAPSLLLALVSAAWASAQVPAGHEFRVNTDTAWCQKDPSIASDSIGGFVVAWSHCGNISARRYDSGGSPKGSEFRVNKDTSPDPDDVRPSVASDPAGSFTVVWERTWFSPPLFDFPFQMYDASGSPVGSERALGSGEGWPIGKGIAPDAGGNFVVTWASVPPDTSSYSVYAQRLDSSGVPRGAEFRVTPEGGNAINESPVVASGAAGNFVVVWEREYGFSSVWARLYDSSGAPRGAEFQVDDNSHRHNQRPAVAAGRDGSFIVAWTQWQIGWGDVVAKCFGADGTPRGDPFLVGSKTLNGDSHPAVASDAAGNFVVAWVGIRQDESVILARRYDRSCTRRGAEFQVNTYTTDSQVYPTVTADALGDFVVAWETLDQVGFSAGIFAQRYGNLDPLSLAVDPASTGNSDGNGVLDPGESVEVKPSFRNLNGLSQDVSFGGVVASFAGPSASGVSYDVADAAASYGPIANGQTATCGDCYRLGVAFGGARPTLHWDATLVEQLSLEPAGQELTRPLHLGESFVDVPKTSGFYRFVETLLHKGVTGGCTADSYCPTSPVTREQLSVFVLTGKEGAGYLPTACETPVFGDVPASSPFCRFVEELSRRGVTSGCGGGNYCPTNPVTREQMAVFLLRTLDPVLSPPACGTPVFGDVPASSPFCRWIEELVRRGVTSGCGGGNYCPTDPVTREQVAVFITATFGLSLYGP